MTLPLTGSLGAAQINAELRRDAAAPFSLNGAEERAMAGLAAGPISFSSFYGKDGVVIVNYPWGRSTGTLDLSTLFTPAQWTTATHKEVRLKAGADYGTRITGEAAIVVPSAWGGTLRLVISEGATVSGHGGVKNGGNGGDAIRIEADSLTGVPMEIVVAQNATVRGGGGGGGRGGQGGPGTVASTLREPASGGLMNASHEWSYGPMGYPPRILWGGTVVSTADLIYSLGEVVVAPYTYKRAGLRETLTVNDPAMGEVLVRRHAVYRESPVVTPTVGGAGGDGAAGRGFWSGWADGAVGLVGEPGAGTGGRGGRSGDFGKVGQRGEDGIAGSAGPGLSGGEGGQPGYAIRGAGRFTLINNGNIIGQY